MNEETNVTILEAKKQDPETIEQSNKTDTNFSVDVVAQENLLKNCIFENIYLEQLDDGILHVLQHLVIYNKKKIRAFNLDPGDRAIGIDKLHAYKFIFENIFIVEKLASIRFMKYELLSLLYEPKNLYIPFPPRTIHLNLDVSNHPEEFANFLFCEEIFGVERYFLSLEKMIKDETFWEKIIDRYRACENPQLLIKDCEFACSRPSMPWKISRKFLEKRKIPLKNVIDYKTICYYTIELARNWKLKVKFIRMQAGRGGKLNFHIFETHV